MTTKVIKLTQIVLVLLFTAVAGKINAQEHNRTESPYFQVKTVDAQIDVLPMKETSVNVKINGVIANVHVRQVYKNEGKIPLEASYIFPGSTKAAVHNMTMSVGERVLQAKIYEKETARKLYKKAKSEGKTTSLLEQYRPNVFHMNVANILPGDEIKTDLYYTELLIPENGIYEFVYPTVVMPRHYGNTGKLNTNDAFVKNPYTNDNTKANYKFDISVNIDAGMPVNGVKCESHKADIQFLNENQAKCKLNKHEKFAGNKDFILKYNLRGNEIKSGLLMHQGKDENYFLLMMQPPKREAVKEIAPREYIFVVDVSGSMNGFPIDISKELMSDLLKNMKTTDKFNVVLFAGTSNLLADTSLNANDENLQKAIEFINKQEGSGGTELGRAIKLGLSVPKLENYSRTFVFLTDGAISAEAECFKLITENEQQNNYFTFGIGSSVNRHLIEGLARIGQGESFAVTQKQFAKEKANAFKSYVEKPVLTNIKFLSEEIETYDILPLSYPDVFAERPIIIFGKYKGVLDGKIKISGLTGKKKFSQTFNLKNASISSDNEALKYLWARKKIQLLNDKTAFVYNNDTKTEITGIGLKYNLLTKYTSFLAVDTLSRNSENISTVNQAISQPKGVSSNTNANYNSNSIIIVENDEDIDYSAVEVIEEDEEDVEVKIFLIVEQMPEFPGGDLAMRNFLAENVEYPNQARENDIQGKVYVRFVVRANGKIDSVHVVRGVDPLLDKAAIEVVKKLPNFMPGNSRGKAVDVWYTVPITFKLED